jgi:hypothetical protein
MNTRDGRAHCTIHQENASRHLNHEAMDSISWKFGKDGCYLASSAYEMQFL